MRPTFSIAAASVAALLTVTDEAQAQAPRTFVSGHGEDTNPCTLAAPCRSFAQALTQTEAGGEIAVLDTAGYGTVTINKSISIVNEEGVEAGVAMTTAIDAIDISVGSTDVVNLRGLTLTGGGVGINGVLFSNLGTLNIQNCVIRGFFDGLSLLPNGTAQFNVSDTIISNSGSFGIAIEASGSGTVTGVFNRIQAIGNVDTGFFVNGSSAPGALNVTIANSLVTNNTSNGVGAASTGGAALTQMMVVNTVVSNNGNGVLDEGSGSTTYLAKNTIAGNTTAFNIINSGALFSFGDNDIKSNGNDGAAIPLVSTK